MKFTFGRVKEDGSKACYLKRLEGKIFVCWFTPEDMITKNRWNIRITNSSCLPND
jgi:hypothetical protein